jgi:hypothetical protein
MGFACFSCKGCGLDVGTIMGEKTVSRT